MKKLVCLSILFCTLYACQQDRNSAEDKAAAAFKGSTSVQKNFSDTTALDTFVIELKGEKTDDMLLKFKIITAAGKEIYNVDLNAKSLVDNTDPNIDLRKEKDRQSFIKNIAANFFDEENFLEPAVLEDQQSDNNTPDKAFFVELKKTQLNGFRYRLGKESNLYIAWSTADQKVKVYYKCC